MNFEIISSGLNANKHLDKILKRITKNKKEELHIIELGALWTLLQANYRPDLTSPTSSMIVVLRHNNKIKYFNFYRQKNDLTHLNSTPLLDGISYLLKTYSSPYSIKTIGKLLTKYMLNRPIIDKELEHFILTHKKQISNHPSLIAAFFRGDWTLRSGEKIAKLNYNKLLKKYSYDKYQKRTKITTHLFPYSFNNDKEEIFCNHDLNLYKYSIYPVLPSKEKVNTFAVQNKNGDFFIAITSQKLNIIEPYDNTFLISGKPSQIHQTICIKNDSTPLAVISTSTRDPGQQIYNLLELNLTQSMSLESFKFLVDFPRHYFLLDPKRMLFETTKANEKQLKRMLELRFPIYHQMDIGNILINATIEGKRNSFIIDSRNSENILCVDDNIKG